MAREAAVAREAAAAAVETAVAAAEAAAEAANVAAAAALRKATVAEMMGAANIAEAKATRRTRALRAALRRWRQRCWLAWRQALLEASAARAVRVRVVRRWRQHARQTWRRVLLAADALSRRRRRWLQQALQQWVRSVARAAAFGSQLAWGSMLNAPSWACPRSPPCLEELTRLALGGAAHSGGGACRAAPGPRRCRGRGMGIRLCTSCGF